MQIKEYLKKHTENFKTQLTEKQYEQFQRYFELLVEWNEKINLTAITDAEGVSLKHFADCITVFDYVNIPQNSKIIDVGTGAGFPGLVLKIARPDLQITLLDSLNKRLVFLQEVCDELELDCKIIHSRAEDGARQTALREQFDYSFSRAVAQLNVLSEYCLPYVRVGGSFCALKGPQAEDEIKNAYSAINTLGGKLKKVSSFALPCDGGERNIVEIEKRASTSPKYPRNFGKIKAKPL